MVWRHKLICLLDKTIEILPTKGADAEHDRRAAECSDLEEDLDKILAKARRQIEYVGRSASRSANFHQGEELS